MTLTKMHLLCFYCANDSSLRDDNYNFSSSMSGDLCIHLGVDCDSLVIWQTASSLVDM